MKSSNFFTELKRRNVIRMAGLYLVGAWLLVQVAGTVLPMFGAPDWLPRSIVILLAIGFLPALIFSWVFELTPEGLKRDEDVPAAAIDRAANRAADGSHDHRRARARAGLFCFRQICPDAAARDSPPSSSAEPKPAPNEKSVAVLAFDNLSDDKGSEYFSDGISEELLTVLQKIPGLHVAARTSAFSFKGKNATAQEIGEKLGVARLVEGSVRKAGDVVRIAARLTQANTGEEIWSENYTRDLKDVFAVQTELAQTIVGQLRGQLTDGAADPTAKAAIQAEVQAAEKGGTKNVEAHQHYLQGRFYENRHSEKGVTQALVEYQKAVELDPGYALAWAGLAESHLWMCDFGGEIGRAGFDAHLASAREATARAIELERDLPEALRARAHIQLNFDFDWKGADDSLQTALRLAPADSTLFIAAGNLADGKGDVAHAMELYRNAVTLDPVNPRARSFLAYHLAITRQFAEAQAEYCPRYRAKSGGTLGPRRPRSCLPASGKFEDAATAAHEDAAEWARLYVTAMARWSQKRIPEADAALAALIQDYADVAACQIGAVYAWRGEKDRAFEWLERARRQRDSGLVALRSEPVYDNLHGDPRWDAFLRTMGLADDQLK